ncbi:MAG: ribonuclease P protein component [Microgenomates group bacterium]
MLASKNRLKKKINFARIEIDGVMHQSKSFGMGIYDRLDVYNSDNNNLDENDRKESHFGFIVSTKISKKAVVRNRIKRVIAEVIRKRLGEIKRGLDVVFLIKPSAVKISKEELENETNEIITKNLQINTLSHS